MVEQVPREEEMAPPEVFLVVRLPLQLQRQEGGFHRLVLARHHPACAPQHHRGRGARAGRPLRPRAHRGEVAGLLHRARRPAHVPGAAGRLRRPRGPPPQLLAHGPGGPPGRRPAALLPRAPRQDDALGVGAGGRAAAPGRGPPRPRTALRGPRGVRPLHQRRGGPVDPLVFALDLRAEFEVAARLTSGSVLFSLPARPAQATGE
mmetsp:Transcript_122328/g.346853  ORF Transcript_122328/g.346853 Transcript_122328/m.346853 type:complete len:205 (+) Transcript_122328:945-1559(+)